MSIKDRMSIYLKQDLSWEKAKQDDDGEIVYDEYGIPRRYDAVTIKGRSIGKTHRTVSKEGVLITTNTYVITQEGVGVDDTIDGRVVVDSTDIVNRHGEVIGVECYL